MSIVISVVSTREKVYQDCIEYAEAERVALAQEYLVLAKRMSYIKRRSRLLLTAINALRALTQFAENAHK